MGCTTALLYMSEHVNEEVSKGNLVGISFLGIKAGSETVRHGGKQGQCAGMVRFGSYLEIQEQYVQVEASFSETGNVECHKEVQGPLTSSAILHPNDNL